MNHPVYPRDGIASGGGYEGLPSYRRSTYFGYAKDDYNGPVVGNSARSILRSFRLQPDFFKGKRVLDIGCGLSTIHADLLTIGCAPATSVVLDARSEATKFQREHNPHAIVLQASASHLPFTANEFDIVYSHFCMPMWAKSASEIDQFFKEAVRVLRPAGVLAINGMFNFSQTDEKTSADITNTLMTHDVEFNNPLKWNRLRADSWDIVVAQKVV